LAGAYRHKVEIAQCEFDRPIAENAAHFPGLVVST